MTNVIIEKFVDTPTRKDKLVNIHFRGRDNLHGVFVFGNDYHELKKKNFWRIVTAQNKEEWSQSGSLSCSRLFNGEAFSRLSDL